MPGCRSSAVITAPDGRRRQHLVLHLLLITAAGACASPLPAPERYDIVVRNGTVIDGTGAPGRRDDVAIRDDRIVLVAPRIAATAARTVIDATGLIVAPGFIEPHAHISDIAAHPDAENFLYQGVTTIVASLHSMDQPYPLAAFLDSLRVAPNTAWTAGHTWMRKRVMRLDNRAPSDSELATMSLLVREAVRDGAFGLGTGLEYTPANFSKTDEVIALARAAIAPNAIYVTHLRDEGAALRPAIEEALTIGRSAGVPVHISHLKITGAANWGGSRAVLQRLDSATAAGTRTSFDVYPYLAYSTYSDLMFPTWALAGGTPAFAARVADPAVRARVISDMRTLFRSQTGNTLESVQFREHPTDASLNGRTLADHLRSLGQPLTLEAGFEALITLQAAGGFVGVFYGMADQDLDVFLQHPMASVSSDGDLVTPGVGFPHPRSYGAFPRVLARYVRERSVLTLESAIHKMTGVPARSIGVPDRGQLRAGAFADLVVFDATTIADVATYADPHHYATGVRHLLINGTPVIANGALTRQRPGRAIRRPE
jgi:N-acyl-D-amino-acid deacylase